MKNLFIVLVTVVTLVVGYKACVDYCNMPVVLKNPAGTVVGCFTNETKWERQKADSLVCLNVLKGNYEIDYVAK